MKRFLMTLTAFLLLLMTVGAPIADAKGASGGGGRGGASFSSKPSSVNLSKPTKSTNSTNKTTKNPTTNAKTSKAAKPKAPTATQINTFKHKPTYSTPYAKPPYPQNSAKYDGKGYYDRDSGGFMTTLATSIGTYLVLDAIMDDGEPVYIDSETGERVSPDDLDELTGDSQDDQGEENSLFAVILTIFVGLLIVGALFFIIFL